MNRSSAEVEREVEETRDSLDRTVEALKEKMTPGNIMSEMSSGLGSTGSQMLTRLGDQVRENPLPLALIGAGLAWLLVSKRSGRPQELTAQEDYGYDDRYYGGGAYNATEASTPSSSIKDKAKGAASSVKEKVGGAVSTAQEKISSLGSSAADGARSSVDRVQALAGSAVDAAASAGRGAQQTFRDALDRDPLIIGAIGLAVGAAVGAALPATPVENRYAGPLRDKVMDRTKQLAQARMDDARGAAQAAYGAVKAELNKPGSEGVEGLTQRAEEIARAGVSAAQQELQGRPH